MVQPPAFSSTVNSICTGILARLPGACGSSIFHRRVCDFEQKAVRRRDSFSYFVSAVRSVATAMPGNADEERSQEPSEVPAFVADGPHAESNNSIPIIFRM